MAGPERDRFGDLIRRGRITAGLTQEELAELTGLSVRAIRDIEKGHTARPRRGSAELLARALRLPDAGGGGTAGAPGCGGVVPRQLPHALAGFAGRETEMTTLTGLLDRLDGPPGAVVISAIGGTAGVGKPNLEANTPDRYQSATFPASALEVSVSTAPRLRLAGQSGMKPVGALPCLR